jgi:hypothetical protein
MQEKVIDNSTRAQHTAHEPHRMVNILCRDRVEGSNGRFANHRPCGDHKKQWHWHTRSRLWIFPKTPNLLPVAPRFIWVKKTSLEPCLQELLYRRPSPGLMLLVASRNSLGCAVVRVARSKKSPKRSSFISSDNYRILTLGLAWSHVSKISAAYFSRLRLPLEPATGLSMGWGGHKLFSLVYKSF